MKKIILELLNRYYDSIAENWMAKLELSFGERLSKSEITDFVNSSLRCLIEVVRTAEYLSLDQYLIDTYNLFLKAK